MGERFWGSAGMRFPAAFDTPIYLSAGLTSA